MKINKLWRDGLMTTENSLRTKKQPYNCKPGMTGACLVPCEAAVLYKSPKWFSGWFNGCDKITTIDINKLPQDLIG